MKESRDPGSMFLDDFLFQGIHILHTPAVGTARYLSGIPGLSTGMKGWKQIRHKQNPEMLAI